MAKQFAIPYHGSDTLGHDTIEFVYCCPTDLQLWLGLYVAIRLDHWTRDLLLRKGWTVTVRVTVRKSEIILFRIMTGIEKLSLYLVKI